MIAMHMTIAYNISCSPTQNFLLTTLSFKTEGNDTFNQEKITCGAINHYKRIFPNVSIPRTNYMNYY